MAWAHMDAVTPEWVFSCAGATVLPPFPQGKTQFKREFGPHPPPKVDWTNSCLNFNWKRSEVFEDVVTSMHEYSFELATHSIKNMLNGPDLDGFDCWWFRNVREAHSDTTADMTVSRSSDCRRIPDVVRQRAPGARRVVLPLTFS